jgi:hypothetical protein
MRLKPGQTAAALIKAAEVMIIRVWVQVGELRAFLMADSPFTNSNTRNFSRLRTRSIGRDCDASSTMKSRTDCS